MPVTPEEKREEREEIKRRDKEKREREETKKRVSVLERHYCCST
jgi:hypothetical protein